jgi:hypothetical protein
MYLAEKISLVFRLINSNATLAEDWTEWTVSLSEFAGINLTNVDTTTLGLSSVTGGTGMLPPESLPIYFLSSKLKVEKQSSKALRNFEPKHKRNWIN